ncbi:hypothetical protein ABZS86_27745 [Streptomyces sp. NPDC005355]|uniref:Gfo/Idh/MocA family protein n=1 Tax=Streptomyces sp. NPDC005355 TaxID=3157038 RepID=UPI0033AD8490
MPILGEIDTVQALGHRPRAQRVVRTGPDAGVIFPVEVPAHVSVLTSFRSGVVGTSIYSFDAPVRRQTFEITGSEGTIEVPVSGFDGPTRIPNASSGGADWGTVPPPRVHRERGVGVLEMARAIRVGRQPRASALACHVLDVMLAVEESAETGTPVQVRSETGPITPVEAESAGGSAVPLKQAA